MIRSVPEIFTSVRDELLGEAERSPGLLADLANLERYIAETYSARSFIELLQNADDAKATRFLVTCHGEWLICANDGQEFSRQDFYSLCRSASSVKRRGQTIGYRGIGFKSVVGVASSVHLISGELRATFSRDLTQRCLGTQTPIPLVRIPHVLALNENDSVTEVIRQLEESRYSSIFVFGGLDVERVQDEFDQFDADYLLFLRHISEAILSGAVPRSYRCTRRTLDENTREISIAGPDRRAEWRIRHTGQCDISFSLVDKKPAPLNAAEAVVHAFLPTLESTGFGVRINADFSTDPSRTRVIFDSATLACIDNAANAIADSISETIFASRRDLTALACLTPTIDLATLSLQKRSFRTELVSQVKKRLDHLKEKVALLPNWLNSFDARNIADLLNQALFVPSLGEGDAQTNFMRYLGVKTLSIESVIKAAEMLSISPKGCAEIVAYCMRNVGAGIGLRRLLDMPVWISSGSTVAASLTELIRARTPLDHAFVETIDATGITNTDLCRLLRSAGVQDNSLSILLLGVGIDISSCTTGLTLSGQSEANRTDVQLSLQRLIDPLLPDCASKITNRPASLIITSRSIPAWRGAEQYIASMLREHGYQVEDRSRQNLGYDLYAERDGRKYYVEVKLLDYAGQPFIITSNEEVVAREAGDSYVIALSLRGSNEDVHVNFIRDPTRALKFVRQCRQWVWECSEYQFDNSFVS